MTILTMLRTRLLPPAVLGAAAVALLAFAACNDGDDGNGGTDGGSPAAADTVTDEDGDGAAGGEMDDATNGAADGASDDTMDGAMDGESDGTVDGGADDGTADGGADGEQNGGGVTEIQMIEGIQFDPTQVTVPAGTSVTIVANNVAGGVPHSFALYTSQEAAGGGEAPIVETDTCTGPCEEQVELNLDGGQYYFRCEVHGDSMSGSLTAR